MNLEIELVSYVRPQETHQKVRIQTGWGAKIAPLGWSPKGANLASKLDLQSQILHLQGFFFPHGGFPNRIMPKYSVSIICNKYFGIVNFRHYYSKYRKECVSIIFKILAGTLPW